MADKTVSIKVENLRQLRTAMSKVDKNLTKDLRKINKKAAQVVADEAERTAPVGPSGKLQNSVGVRASNTSASVKVGSASRVPYAGAVVYGWKNRPQGGSNPATPFVPEALVKELPTVRRIYEADLDKIVRVLESKF